MDRHTSQCFVMVVFLCTLFALPPSSAHADRLQGGTEYLITLQRWEEAEKLFRNDKNWLGGDGASSVDLGKQETLWLFGDSFVATKGSTSRRDAEMVRNSISIQSGRDPKKASMKFFWKSRDGRPASFFAEDGEEWFWPGSGIVHEGELIIFLMRIHVSESELGFSPTGWKAVKISNPRSNPGAWTLRDLACPPTGDILVGSSSILIQDGFLYAFSTLWTDNSVYLARWPLSDIAKERLTRPRWWMGKAAGWVEAGHADLKPVPVFSNAQVEFTVHHEPLIRGFLQVQTLSLLEPCIAVRTSSRMTGPWSGALCLFQPPEKDQPGLLLYAGKAHKAFAGEDLAFTYAVNTTDMERIYDDMSIYYPMVLKGTVKRLK